MLPTRTANMRLSIGAEDDRVSGNQNGIGPGVSSIAGLKTDYRRGTPGMRLAIVQRNRFPHFEGAIVAKQLWFGDIVLVN